MPVFGPDVVLENPADTELAFTRIDLPKRHKTDVVDSGSFRAQ